MAKPQGEQEQWERRRSITARDQHGREYHCEVDKDTMGYVGLPTPKNFRSPIPVPNKHFKQVKGELGRFHIDYPNWKRDLMLAESARTVRMRQLAEKMYGNAFSTMLKDPPGDLLYKLGAAPVPIEFVMAMEAGKSPWALGLRQKNREYHPIPKWVTPDLKQRMDEALSTGWTGAAWADADLPVALDGQFEDEPVASGDDEPDAIFQDEEIVDEAPFAIAGAGREADVVIPVERGRGRPRKNKS